MDSKREEAAGKREPRPCSWPCAAPPLPPPVTGRKEPRGQLEAPYLGSFCVAGCAFALACRLRTRGPVCQSWAVGLRYAPLFQVAAEEVNKSVHAPELARRMAAYQPSEIIARNGVDGLIVVFAEPEFALRMPVAWMRFGVFNLFADDLFVLASLRCPPFAPGAPYQVSGSGLLPSVFRQGYSLC